MLNEKKGTMRRIINEIFTLFRRDEELMRLLNYEPEDHFKKIPDPLDPSLPNIVDEYSEKYWEIVENSIKTAIKSPNIELEAMCRIYLYAGRRRPDANSFLIANQEVVVDILVHDSFTKDMRLEAISDRVNELLALERIDGAYSWVEYVGGAPRHAPTFYSSYEHNFLFHMNKKG